MCVGGGGVCGGGRLTELKLSLAMDLHGLCIKKYMLPQSRGDDKAGTLKVPGSRKSFEHLL